MQTDSLIKTSLEVSTRHLLASTGNIITLNNDAEGLTKLDKQPALSWVNTEGQQSRDSQHSYSNVCRNINQCFVALWQIKTFPHLSVVCMTQLKSEDSTMQKNTIMWNTVFLPLREKFLALVAGYKKLYV
jgi:hypothetical protein